MRDPSLFDGLVVYSRRLPFLPSLVSWNSHSVSIRLPGPLLISSSDLIFRVPEVQPLAGKTTDGKREKEIAQLTLCYDFAFMLLHVVVGKE